MSFWLCVVYFFGNFIFFVSYFVTLGNRGKKSAYYPIIMLIGNILLFTSLGAHFFVYFSFNKIFRNNLKSLFRHGRLWNVVSTR